MNLDDDELDDWEDPEEADADDETDTVACPMCGCDVYEDAVRCPLCGAYITHQTHALLGRPWWWIVLGLLGMLAAVVGFLGLSL